MRCQREDKRGQPGDTKCHFVADLCHSDFTSFKLTPWRANVLYNALMQRATPDASKKANEYLCAKELAGLLGFSEKSVRRWTRKCKLPHHKVGRWVRYDLETVRRFLDENR